MRLYEYNTAISLRSHGDARLLNGRISIYRLYVDIIKSKEVCFFLRKYMRRYIIPTTNFKQSQPEAKMFDMSKLGDMAKIANQAREMQDRQERSQREQTELLKKISSQLETLIAVTKQRG